MAETDTAPGQGGQAPADGDRIDQLAARQERTETKIDRTETKLDQLINLVGGGKDGGGQQDAGGQAPAAGGPADHLGEIKRAIRDVRAEEEQAAADAAHKAEHDRLKGKPEPEHQPRESGPSWKERFQNVMFGGDSQ